MPENEELMRPVEQSGDDVASIRPKSLDEFIGQDAARRNLRIFIESARRRNASMDHTLFYGPPGLGKTTLARIVARELGVNLKVTSGPVLARAGDLAAILTSIGEHDVLFIDEIHRLNPVVEEILYPALEDFALDLVIGSGPHARTVRIELQPFTLIGATTRLGLLTTPLRDRFGIPIRLDFYSADQLDEIVARAARVLGVAIKPEGSREIASRSRGTPRIANRLLRRVADFAVVESDGQIDVAIARRSLERLGVDEVGLDTADRLYLRAVANQFAGGPVGLDTMSAVLSESRDAIEEVMEPFLLQRGYIQRTPRGRVLSPAGWSAVGLQPDLAEGQRTLFDDAEE